MPVLLITGERLRLRVALALAGVEQIAAVDGKHQFLVEETLAQSQVYGIARIAVSLCDNLARAVTARGLKRDVVRQHQRSLHTRVACEIMITLENTKESVYATDFENKSDDTSVNQKDEYVIYSSDNGETPVLIMEYFPKVQGVTVVCSGGNNVAVKEKVIEAVTSLFSIPANRVSVSKLKD